MFGNHDVPRFPNGFLFGASTSGHQVEGGNDDNTNWGRWARENCTRLADEVGPKTDFGNGSAVPPKIWEQIKKQAKDPDNYIAGDAANHWDDYENHLDQLVWMGLTAYRFSIEWSRIEPQQGVFDTKAIKHYRKVIAACHARGITPFVGLWHWTEPLWFTDAGGWESKQAPEHFRDYARHVAEQLGNEATFWVTINEPEVYAIQGYILGMWPPGKVMKPRAYLRVVKHLVQAHQGAYHELKRVNPSAQVGAAINTVHYEVYGGLSAPLGWLWKQGFEWMGNRRLRGKIASTSDWMGLNYYMRFRFGLNPQKPINTADDDHKSDLGWELFPEGHYHTLMRLKRYNLPVYVTESGLADLNDDKRADYIQASLIAIRRAMRDGVDVHGYFHWSLLDNFEWDKGHWPQFGMLTRKGQLKASAGEYKLIVAMAQGK